jgi:hypothetical protein
MGDITSDMEAGHEVMKRATPHDQVMLNHQQVYSQLISQQIIIHLGTKVISIDKFIQIIPIVSYF